MTGGAPAGGAPAGGARAKGPTSVLGREEWKARWIARPPLARPGSPRAPYLLRRRFRLELPSGRPAERARLYATALGLYQVALNGTRLATGPLRPGWTDHRRRVQYQVLDATPLLVAGENVLSAIVAPGWYGGRIASRLAADSAAAVPVPELLVQLEAEGEDGERFVVGSDERFEWQASAILSSDLYDGEDWDLRLGADWWEPDRKGPWQPVEVTQGSAAELVPDRIGPPRERVSPVAVSFRADGTALVDSGRNDTGYLRLVVDDEPGRRVEVDYAEILDLSGNLYRDNLRSARCAETFVLAGGTETLAPSFSFRGFRYAEVRGLSGPDRLCSAESVSLTSAIRRTGWFSCSEPLLNEVYELMVCSLEANYLEVPTDCPQRDERMGWMADALLFAPIAAYTYDIGPLMAKWLDDVLDARTPDGGFADVAPRPSGRWPGRSFEAGAPAWADAGVQLPFLLYERYGDREVLEAMLPAMLDWLGLVHRENPDGIWRNGRGNDYGDWVPAGPDTSHELFATAWLYRSTAVAAEVAGVLGARDEAAFLAGRARRTRDAFVSAYVDPESGRIADPKPTGSHLAARRFAPILSEETQTGYVMALAFSLVEGELAEKAGRRLAALVERAGRRLQTGFCGSAFLPAVLDRSGRADLAYDLLLRTEPPSLGFMAKMGATSVWERWDSLDEKGWPACPTMNSLNHYAMSSMLSFLVEGICGLRPVPGAPALGALRFAPSLSPRLRQAAFELDAPAGRLAIGWEWLDDERSRARGTVRLPPGTRCDIAGGLAVDGHPAGALREAAVARRGGDGGNGGDGRNDGDGRNGGDEQVIGPGEWEAVWRLA